MRPISLGIEEITLLLASNRMREEQVPTSEEISREPLLFMRRSLRELRVDMNVYMFEKG